MNAAGRPPPHPPPHHSLNLNNSAHSADSIIMNRTEQWQITVQLRTQWEGIGSRENPTEPRRRKSSYGMHIYNYRNNKSSLSAAFPSDQVYSGISFKTSSLCNFDAREYLITCFHMAV